MMKRKLGTNHMSFSGLTRGSSGVIFHHKNLNSTGCPIGSGMTGMILMMILSFSLPSFAYDRCVGGTIITRNEYGAEGAPSTCTQVKCPVHQENEDPKTFCLSEKNMNWWSAYTWCKSNGGTLASFASMCPGVNMYPNKKEGDCPALQGTASSGYAWSSVGSSSDRVLNVTLSTGAVNDNFRYGAPYGTNRALCE